MSPKNFNQSALLVRHFCLLIKHNNIEMKKCTIYHFVVLILDTCSNKSGFFHPPCTEITSRYWVYTRYILSDHDK